MTVAKTATDWKPRNVKPVRRFLKAFRALLKYPELENSPRELAALCKMSEGTATYCIEAFHDARIAFAEARSDEPT